MIPKGAYWERACFSGACMLYLATGDWVGSICGGAIVYACIAIVSYQIDL